MVNNDYVQKVAATARERWEAVEGDLASEVDKLQLRLMIWQGENFGIQPDERFTLGVIEEMGETFAATTLGAVLDGLGDIIVYAGQILASNRLALTPILDLADSYRRQFARSVDIDRVGDAALERAGELSHLVLKTAQKIRVGTAGHDVYREKLVDALAKCIGIVQFHILGRMLLGSAANLGAIYLNVGGEVLQRNWKKNAETGA